MTIRMLAQAKIIPFQRWQLNGGDEPRARGREMLGCPGGGQQDGAGVGLPCPAEELMVEGGAEGRRGST